MSKYYIKEKYIQILYDCSSFGNGKIMKSTFHMIVMIYKCLTNNDSFGLRIFKDGYSNHYSTKASFKNEDKD